MSLCSVLFFTKDNRPVSALYHNTAWEPWSLGIGIWILFAICNLVIGISLIKGFDYT